MLTPIQSGLNGANNDHIAINNAILAGNTILLEGTYSISAPIVVPYGGGTVNNTRKCIMANDAIISGTTTNQTVLRWADSWGGIFGNLFLTGTTSGLKLMEVMPELGNANTTVQNQSFNSFENITFNGGDEQLTLMAGIPISGSGSGCWYNNFKNLKFTNGKRAIWFKDNGSSNAFSSGSNSNVFEGITINGSTNTGIQIDAGGGNKFIKVGMENIALGTSPNTTPTGVKVLGSMTNGGANPDNFFDGLHFENVTRHLDNGIASTKAFDHDISVAVGTSFTDKDVAGGSLTAGSGINIASGICSVDSGITANKIVKLDGSGKLPAVDGSQLTGISGGSGNVPTGGSTGQVLAKNSATNYDTVWVTPSGGSVPAPNYAQTTAATTAGTTSNTGIMAGLNIQITPVNHGVVQAIIGGAFNNSGVGGGFGQIHYGTGTPPSHGASLAGTAAGAGLTWIDPNTNAYTPFTFSTIISGLTLSTTYWIDICYGRAASSGTTYLTNTAGSALELI